jgi:hypothetical protein
MILDVRIETLAKLHDNMGALEVASPFDHLAKIIHILIDRSGALEVLRGLKYGACCLDLVLGAELGYELHDEILPRRIRQAPHRLVVAHVAIHETRRSIALHERERPHNFRTVIHELVGCEGYVQFARIQERPPLCTIS